MLVLRSVRSRANSYEYESICSRMKFAFVSFSFGYHVSLSTPINVFYTRSYSWKRAMPIDKVSKAVFMVSETIIPYALAAPLVDQNVVYDAENPDHGSRPFNVAVGSLNTLWGVLTSNLQSVGELGVGMRDDLIWIAVLDQGSR
jgi:hypothetical protein